MKTLSDFRQRRWRLSALANFAVAAYMGHELLLQGISICTGNLGSAYYNEVLCLFRVSMMLGVPFLLWSSVQTEMIPK